MSEPMTVLQQAVYSLDKHKAEQQVALRVSDLTPIADYFLIATGNSSTQVRSLAEYLEEDLGQQGIHPLRSEGYTAGDWITLDYGDVLIHIFRREIRDFYGLERLWTDAETIDVTPYLVPSK